MDEFTKDLKAHLFVCTASEGCGDVGGNDIVKELKTWIKDEKLKDQLKVTRSGCLGHCEQAVAGVCYPQKKWLTGLASADGEALKSFLRESLKG